MLFCDSPKFAAEDLDYAFDWSKTLAPDPALGAGADAIAAASLTMVSGSAVIRDDPATTATSVVFWVSGGEAGETCVIRCEIITVQGRTFDELMTLYIRS